MIKKIKIIDCYNIFKKYGNLNIKVKTPYGYNLIEGCDITAKNSKTYTIKTENEKYLKCSPHHKMKCSNGKFISANKLLVGKTKLITEEGTSKVKSLEISNKKEDLYDIQVKNVKQYYSNGIVSHNSTLFKTLTYILYSKSLETETKMKYGDIRYVNNKLNVNHCMGYLVIEANGEYYAIKRETKVERKKDGEIKGTPTTVTYYKLNSPDDDFLNENYNNNETEKDKNDTQRKIDKIIGSYENFKRVTLTTSDTLNKILSNEKADFIDSLLFDSGLDIFDKKLFEFKEYNKELSKIPKVSCNIETSLKSIKNLELEIEKINDEINDLENVKLPELGERIIKGENYKDDLVKKLHKIDDDIYKLNVNQTNEEIRKYNLDISELNKKENKINNAISELKENYDENKLNSLIEKKELHKQEEYDLKLKIKNINNDIDKIKYDIQTENNKILLLKKDGSKKKNKMIELKNSKNCPTCKQPLSANYQDHINEKINELKKEVFSIANEIKNIENNIIPSLKKLIDEKEKEIDNVEKEINSKSIKMENVLKEIGELINDKNEVEKRKELQNEVEKIPLNIENLKLKIDNLQRKIDQYTQSLNQIKENNKIEILIEKSKEKILQLKNEENQLKDEIYNKTTIRTQNLINIKETNDLIIKFKEQEKQDRILNIYKKCIHRDGIPTQLLKTYAIPKINNELSKLLSNIGFKVWLDENDLKLKLAYNNKMNAIIDAISSSGKERTFSSICLKSALNRINAKSKPKILLLDEVMGKLTEESVEEFIDILKAIKENINKLLIVEHNVTINPDYIIEVKRSEEGISSLTLE